MSHDLSAMGAAKVFKTEYQGKPCIEKENASVVEIDFYRKAAKEFTAIGVRVPTLLDFDTAHNRLTIEYIPNSIDIMDLNKHSDTFRQLSLIHQSTLSYNPLLMKHQWTPEQTEAALISLQLPEQTQAFFGKTQEFNQEIFSPTNLISGDTNPGNWGTRDDGELVLFDWERFGTGSPAIDLIPMIKGMGNRNDYEQIIERYLSHGGSGNFRALKRQIVIAAAWIVVEVTNLLTVREKSQLPVYLDWFRKTLPAWVDEVEKEF